MTVNGRDTNGDKIDVETFVDHQVIRRPNPLRRAMRRVIDTDREDPISRAEKALEGLADQFTDWMKQECERLAAAHAAIVERGLSAGMQDELFRAAHDIKGDAVTFGYPLAAAAADSLCRIIDHAPDFSKVPPDLVHHHVSAIQAIVREHKRFAVSTVGDELSQRLRRIADEYLTDVNKDRPEHLEVILGPNLVPGS